MSVGGRLMDGPRFKSALAFLLSFWILGSSLASGSSLQQPAGPRVEGPSRGAPSAPNPNPAPGSTIGSSSPAHSAGTGAPKPKVAAAPGMYRDRFESGRLAWRREDTDASIQILGHEWTDQFAHEGKGSERIRFIAGQGSSLYYSHELPKVPIETNLEIGLYARSNRVGARVQARVVLPGDLDPDTRQPSFVIISGTAVDTADRWQKLILENIPLAVSRQARTLRIATKRPVSLQGAYIDQVVVNLYCGAGETDVCLDDLTVFPVPAEIIENLAATAAAESANPDAPALPARTTASRASLVDNVFRLDGKPYVFSIIDAKGARLAPLVQAGFNVLAVDGDDAPERIEEAVKHGLLLMPKLSLDAGSDPDEAIEAALKHPASSSVAFWRLGEELGSELEIEDRDARRDMVREVVGKLRRSSLPGSRLTTGMISGMLDEYSRPPRNLDILGIDLKSWGRQRDPAEAYLYLRERMDQSFENPNAVFWALIDATPNPAFTRAIWGDSAPPDWGVPRVQPEQLRIWTYLALAAGCRGIGFRGDAGLTGPDQVSLRTEMAFLNLEISLFRTLLSQAKRPGPLFKVSPADPLSMTARPAGGTNYIVRNSKPKEVDDIPSIKAASFLSPDKRTYLLLVTDLAPSSQWQPPQSAYGDIHFTVPALEGAQAYEVTPGGVKKLIAARGPGGLEVTLPDFGVATMIVVTTDLPLVDRIEAQIARNRTLAVQMAIEQAKLQIDWVAECDERLRGVWENALPPLLPAPKDEQEGEKRVSRRKGAIEIVAEARGYLTRGRTDIARRKAYAAKDLDAPFEPLEDSPERVLADADAIDFITQARDLLAEAQDQLESFDYIRAWGSARRAEQPLRVLKREHFDRALRGVVDAVVGPLPVPARGKAHLVPDPDQVAFAVSSPAIVAFNTLPQHWLWVDKMRDWTFGKSILPDGTFEDPKLLEKSDWRVENYGYNGIEARVDTVARSRPKSSGKRLLRLNVAPVYPEGIENIDPDAKLTKQAKAQIIAARRQAIIDQLSPFLDHPAAAIRTPEMKVKANQLVRVRVWVHKQNSNAPGAGGLIIRDSLGGEPLQIRLVDGTRGWKEVVFFRRVPADGTFSIMIGLAGYGLAEIDDLRVELGSGDTLARGRTPAQRGPIARTPRPVERPVNTARPGDASTPRVR